jgi:ryanodine receptor 2
MSFYKKYIVIASFHQTIWNINSCSSGSVRNRNMGELLGLIFLFVILGYLFGNDVVRLFHGNDECLTIPENWNEHVHK